jgi:hypothetical protein
MAEKLFTILCETCGCRLQVRDASIIGQILNCPKCQSMVLVAPPPGWAPSAAIPETVAPAAQVAKLNQKPKDARWSEATSPTVEPAAASAAAEASPAATADVAQKPTSEATSLPAADALPSARSAWVSPTEKLARQWIGLATGICVGVLLGAGLIWLALRDDEPSVTESPATTAQSALENAASDRVEKPPQTPVKPPPVIPSADKPSPVKSVKSDPSIAVPPAVKPESAPATKQPPAVVTATDAAPPKPHSPPIVHEPPPPAIAADPPPPIEAPDEPPITPDEPPPVRVSRPPLPPVEVQAQLAVSIPRLEVGKAPLDRILDLLSGISTIPITLDASVVEFAQVAADAPIAVRLANTTVKKALDQVVSAAKLSYVVGPDHILVTPAPEIADEWIVVRSALGELSGGNPKRRAEIASLVTTMVAPSTWKTSRPTAGEAEIQVDGDDLVVRQTRAGQKELTQFLERLRTVRRAATGGGDLSLIQTRRQKIDAALARKITRNYAVATPLSKVLAGLRDESKLCILVDWRALRALQIDPQTPARMLADNESVEAALGSLLAPLELTYRILDGRTIQITTPAAAAEAMHVEFYPLGVLAEDASKVDKLVGDFRRAWAQNRGEPAGLFHFDAAGRCLILRHTQSGHNEFERRLTAAR